MDTPALPVVYPGPLRELDAVMAAHGSAIDRLWARDHTLWREDPTEISDRLGWLSAPEAVAADLDHFFDVAQQAAIDGITRVVVIGMGGSSLFPDVLARTFPAGQIELEVLDSTHPAAVRRALELPLDTTLFSVASKSGTTIETRSHLDALWEHRAASLQEPGRQFVAITDPGSQLEELARERGFREVFLAPPDVGGRFSAMTPFGLVPATFLGVDVERLVDLARAELALARMSARGLNPGYRLGVFIAAAVQAGRDKIVLRFGEEAAPFADWVEQLVAESLGKDGVSVVPVVGESDAPVEEIAGKDRAHVVLGDHDAYLDLVGGGQPATDHPWFSPYELGAQVVRWEVATAIAGAILGVQPFDQPDVASAKAATNEVLDRGPSDVALTPLPDALEEVERGDLVAMTAFVDPTSEQAAALPALQRALHKQTGCTVTVGLGPRYLHSTGQLHKGGSEAVVVLQVVDEDVTEGQVEDVAIPGRDFGFASLFAAQAEGDLEALRSRGRRAHRISWADLAGLL